MSYLINSHGEIIHRLSASGLSAKRIHAQLRAEGVHCHISSIWRILRQPPRPERASNRPTPTTSKGDTRNGSYEKRFRNRLNYLRRRSPS